MSRKKKEKEVNYVSALVTKEELKAIHMKRVEDEKKRKAAAEKRKAIFKKDWAEKAAQYYVDHLNGKIVLERNFEYDESDGGKVFYAYQINLSKDDIKWEIMNGSALCCTCHTPFFYRFDFNLGHLSAKVSPEKDIDFNLTKFYNPHVPEYYAKRSQFLYNNEEVATKDNPIVYARLLTVEEYFRVKDMYQKIELQAKQMDEMFKKVNDFNSCIAKEFNTEFGFDINFKPEYGI